MPRAGKPAKKIEAAFFDVDNTIIRGSSSYLFGKAAFQKGFFTRKDVWLFAWHQFRFITGGETHQMITDIKDKALGLIAGHRAADLEALTEEVFDFHLKPKLWPETVRLAKEHMAAGREVWLVTATPQEIADVLAHKLGLTGGLGSIIQRKDGVLTGKIEGHALHGKFKRKAIRALAKERHISLRRSYAYSDSHNDLPMLTLVGHAVAVNPDKTLTVHAKAAGWPILDFKKRELKANRDAAFKQALKIKKAKTRA
ncbi:MAG: HAD family hydrolase [Micrococcales bacterium]